LLSLPRGARLHLGATAVVALTGLRSPCHQVYEFQSGLVKELVFKDDHGDIVRRIGVMGIVLADGEVRAGDAIEVEFPVAPHQSLECV
jgi:MOSC domain-containing protein YiiM